jgi:poly-gamma-glutamate capsule biosynthesis protein CapA/YwtB (metallophosphatase superfamily)
MRSASSYYVGSCPRLTSRSLTAQDAVGRSVAMGGTMKLAARWSIVIVGLAVGMSPAGAQSPPPTLSLALTGDSIITRPISVFTEPPFTRLIELVRGADAAFTNLEMLFHDYEPYAMNESGGTYMRGEPALVKELVWAGFDMVSRANNHSGDFGALGMNLTTKYVAAAGLVQAGVGQSLAEAREATFLETPRGRIALISVASTFPDHSRAGKTRGDMPARPGLNPLRFSTTYIVTRERFGQLRQAMVDINGRPPADGDALNFFGRRFIVGDTPGIVTEPNPEDVAEIASVVKSASRLADLTLVTIHAHEGTTDRLVPAQFLVTFAHAMVEAGADLFVGHGPHVLRGIELYRGKPILYSLGDFIFQNETLLRLPSENYETYDLGPEAHVADFNDRRYRNDTTGFPVDRLIWEAVVAVPKFEGRTLRELALHPITLGYGKGRTARGRPMLADGELGRKILSDVERLSQPFGTTLTVRGGVAYVDPARESR